MFLPRVGGYTMIHDSFFNLWTTLGHKNVSLLLDLRIFNTTGRKFPNWTKVACGSMPKLRKTLALFPPLNFDRRHDSYNETTTSFPLHNNLHHRLPTPTHNFQTPINLCLHRKNTRKCPQPNQRQTDWLPILPQHQLQNNKNLHAPSTTCIKLRGSKKVLHLYFTFTRRGHRKQPWTEWECFLLWFLRAAGYMEL